MRLYLDTSIFGALFDSELPSRIEVTKKLLDSIIKEKNIGIISNIVLEEIERAPKELKDRIILEMRKVPLEIISEDEKSADLMDIYESEGFIRKSARLDLRHIAVAVINSCDAIVSWNFRDIVNLRTRRAVHSINIKLGLPLIEIVSPEEVIEYEK